MALAALLAGALVLLAGCGSLPTDVQRPVSRALADPAGTPLAQLTAQRRPAGVAALQSGLALEDTADGAYASRLALTQSATRTLDLQYYAIHSDTSTRELLRAVRQVADGRRYLAPGIAEAMALEIVDGSGQSPFESLSTRELEVALLLARGQPMPLIAERLSLSSKTVATYKYRLFEKLAIDNSVTLAHMAGLHGLLDAKGTG